jgi:hypothetical protein
MLKGSALSVIYFCTLLSILLQSQSNAFLFPLNKHHNIYLSSHEIKSAVNDIGYTNGDGRVQNEQFLEWEREEQELWNKDTQTKRKKVIREEFDSNSDGLPSYMLDLIDEFGAYAEEIDVIMSYYPSFHFLLNIYYHVRIADSDSSR